jgi:membrane-associated protein
LGSAAPVADLEHTQRFFERHGGKTIILARFLPIVRTFAPFVAGVGNMNYARFFAYNVVGGFIWAVGITLLGYALGQNRIVKENFELVLVGIVVFSLVPGTIAFLKNRYSKAPAPAIAAAEGQLTKE